MGMLNVLLGDLASPAETLHAKTEEEVYGLVMNVSHAGEEIQDCCICTEVPVVGS